MAINNNTNSILGTANFVAAYVLNRPTQGVAGALFEPALTAANFIMSTVLGPPFAWQWNRNTATINAVQGTTDYPITMNDYGWPEKVTVTYVSNPPTNTPSIFEIPIKTSLSADGQQNRPSEICPFLDNNAGTITWRLFPIPDQAYTVTITYQKAPILATSLVGTSLGSITSIAAATVGLSTVYTASGGITGGATNGLANTYLNFSGTTISGTTFPNNGLYFCTASTGTSVTVNNPNGVLQSGSGGIIQSPTTWAPIPDKYNFLYEHGLLAMMHGMYDYQMYLEEMQIFLRQLVGVSEGLSDVAKSIFLEERLGQLRTQAYYQASTSANMKRAQ